MTKNQELITAQPSTLLTRLFVSVATVLFILLLASCSDDDDAPTVPKQNPYERCGWQRTLVRNRLHCRL